MSNDENETKKRKNMNKEDLEKTMSAAESFTDADREELYEDMSRATANSLLESAYQGSTDKIKENQIEVVRRVGCKLISTIIVNDLMEKEEGDPLNVLQYFEYYQKRIISQVQTLLQDIGDGKSELVEFDQDKGDDKCEDESCGHKH